MVALITGVYTKYSLEKAVEDSIAELHGKLQPVFVVFDKLVEREERQIRDKMIADLPKVHAELMATGIPFSQIPESRLHDVVTRHGFSEGYLLDRTGRIFQTTFDPDRGFNLSSISKGFATWLNGIYGKGEVFTDRLVLSTKTGSLNIYGYYGPKGADTITEVSVDIRSFIATHSGTEYVDFLFKTLFESAMQSNAKVRDVDLFMYNDLAAWSVLNRGVALDSEIRDRLITEKEVRVQLDDRLIVYSRFQPTLKKELFIQDFCTKVVYDIADLNAIIRNFIVYTVLSMILVVPLVYVLVSRAITRRIISPIGAVVQALDAIGKGGYDRSLRVKSVPEVETIANAVNSMHAEIQRREQDLQDAKAVLEQRVAERTKALEHARMEAENLARTDVLTELPNRRSFYEDGDKAFAASRRYGHPLTAIMMDVDHFKQINDTYGHGLGDEVLIAIAGILKSSSRDVDIVGRIGGEEFALVLPETGEADAIVFAERLRVRMADIRVPYEDVTVSLTCSFGIAKRDDDCETFDALLARADLALYEAKRAGRDRVASYEDDKEAK